MATQFMPTREDINHYKGDSWVQTVTCTNNESPVDLTGATIKAQIRTSPGESVLFEATEVDGITITDNTFTINKVVDIAAGRHQYDIQVTFASGQVETARYGLWDENGDITR